MVAEISADKNGGLFLNDDELDALQALVHGGYPLSYVLYVQELRRHMDRRTGVVGARRRVCEKGMQETLERCSGPGPNGTPKNRSRQFIQRQLLALSRYGLLERLPKQSKTSPMLFFLPLAVPGLIRSQETRTRTHTKTDASVTKKNTVVVSIYGDKDLKPEQRPGQRPGQHQEDITTTTETAPFSMDQLAAVNMEMVMGSYHQMLPGLPPLRVATEGHRLLVARVWYMPPTGKHQTEDFWRGYFGACANSDFLMGRIVPNQRKGKFKANFKSLVDPDRVLKIINGEYT